MPDYPNETVQAAANKLMAALALHEDCRGTVTDALHDMWDAGHASAQTPEPTATLIVARSYSKCSACGHETLPSEKRHARVSGFGGGQPGCGARFTAITADASRLDDYHRAELARMRPDLPLVEPHEAHR